MSCMMQYSLSQLEPCFRSASHELSSFERGGIGGGCSWKDEPLLRVKIEKPAASSRPRSNPLLQCPQVEISVPETDGAMQRSTRTMKSITRTSAAEPAMLWRLGKNDEVETKVANCCYQKQGLLPRYPGLRRLSCGSTKRAAYFPVESAT